MSRRTIAAALLAIVASIMFPGAATRAAGGHPVGVANAVRGSWTVDAAGGVSALGGAPELGSLNRAPSSPVVGITASESRRGYWLVAADGGIFSFGDARFLGSTGAVRLNQPIVGMASTPSGDGYWLVAADGGIFSFGDASFLGRPQSDAKAVVPLGRGYRIALVDGRVATYEPSKSPSASAPRVLARRTASDWPFDVSSPWNTPLGSGAQFDSSTSAATRALLDPRVDTWVNAEQYSHPIVQATNDDPVVRVRVRGEREISLRVPRGAQPAAGSDAHLHVVAPDGRWLDEMWLVDTTNEVWTAGHHVRTDLHGPGVGAGGVRAYGGSAIGGLIRSWEIEAGTIRHVLALAIDDTQLRSKPRWPATAEDSNAESSYSGPIPMGSLVAIPPDVDTSALQLNPSGRALAAALQNFGAYVVDRAGAFTLFAEPSLAGSTTLDHLRSEFRRLRPLLRIVTNNGPLTVGGGGTPRAGHAPPIEG